MTEHSITAAEFFRAFVAEVTKPDGDYKPYTGKDGFTVNVVQPAMRRIFRDKASYGYEYDYYAEGEPDKRHGEFYKIDYTAFENRTEDEKANERYGFNAHWWKLIAAVEHENAADDWNYEVLKLAPIRCPLRVVIGYSDRRIADSDRLSYISRMLEEVEACKHGEFLIIIGNDKRGKAFYRGYLYDFGQRVFNELKTYSVTFGLCGIEDACVKLFPEAKPDAAFLAEYNRLMNQPRIRAVAYNLRAELDENRRLRLYGENGVKADSRSMGESNAYATAVISVIIFAKLYCRRNAPGIPNVFFDRTRIDESVLPVIDGIALTD